MKSFITDFNIISPLGMNREDFWNNLISKNNIFRQLQFEELNFENPVFGAAIEDFDPSQFMKVKGLRLFDRTTKLFLSNLHLHFKETLESLQEKCRTGLAIGTALGSINSISSFDRTSVAEGPAMVNPNLFPNTVINAPTSRGNIFLGIKNMTATISTGFASGLDAVIYSIKDLHFNRNDLILTGGMEEMTFESLLGFLKLKLLADKPSNCKPFDKSSTGIMQSEGAYIVQVESENSINKTGNKPLAEIIGYGRGFNPEYYKTKKSIDIAAQTIQKAINNAGIKSNDITAVFTSANGHPGYDNIEAESLNAIFRDNDKINLTAIKSILGDSYGAGGAANLTAALLAISNETIPPTANFSESNSDFINKNLCINPLYLPSGKILINSFGLGYYSSLIINPVQ